MKINMVRVAIVILVLFCFFFFKPKLKGGTRLNLPFVRRF